MRYFVGLFFMIFVGIVNANEGEFAVPTSQQDFASAFQLLPEISQDAPNWGERFRREMPTVESPYYGVNVVDVRQEHYDAVFQNIQGQVQGAEQLFGGKLHFFSARDYGEIRRVIFIIYFENFPDTPSVLDTLRSAGADIPSDATEFPDILDRSALLDGVRSLSGRLYMVDCSGHAGERVAIDFI